MCKSVHCALYGIVCQLYISKTGRKRQCINYTFKKMEKDSLRIKVGEECIKWKCVDVKKNWKVEKALQGHLLQRKKFLFWIISWIERDILMHMCTLYDMPIVSNIRDTPEWLLPHQWIGRCFVSYSIEYQS